jgi:ABC-type transport system involved in cytochrome c biogenesis ATPase subunit/GNAT superfamily N-acetyltransferase
VIVEVHNSCDEFDSYRAARVKSLFNAESGANFRLTADLPIDEFAWNIGVVVGPSGSGKTSIGRRIFGDESRIYSGEGNWPGDRPIVDAIDPGGSFDGVTAALAAVGLGDVPAWLRPYPVLSNGEKFRADLARIIAESPQEVCVDEFTSVVDRQIAKFGALAFAKGWRRTGGKAVLLTPHYDVLEWLEPDWVFDTATRHFSKERLRRPQFELEIRQTGPEWWDHFKAHYYLELPRPIAPTYYLGTVEGEPVCHLAVTTRPGMVEARSTRLVVMPEWQGAGVGMRFLNEVAAMWLAGENRFKKPMPTLFHTSHPGLCAGLRRSRDWVQVSCALYGVNRKKSATTKKAAGKSKGFTGAGGYGGHFRAVQGFRYLGEHTRANRERREAA